MMSTKEYKEEKEWEQIRKAEAFADLSLHNFITSSKTMEPDDTEFANDCLEALLERVCHAYAQGFRKKTRANAVAVAIASIIDFERRVGLTSSLTLMDPVTKKWTLDIKQLLLLLD